MNKMVICDIWIHLNVNVPKCMQKYFMFDINKPLFKNYAIIICSSLQSQESKTMYYIF